MSLKCKELLQISKKKTNIPVGVWEKHRKEANVWLRNIKKCQFSK